ncbi:MAG: hypothetical protein ABIH20_05540 [Candidatus Diapherotrites archaeon]
MPGPRRRSTGQHNTRRPKQPTFTSGQKVHVTGGQHTGKRGRIKSSGPRVSVIEIGTQTTKIVKGSTKYNPQETSTLQVTRKKFIRVSTKHVTVPIPTKPRATTKSKKTDGKARKQSRIQQLINQAETLEKSRKYNGRLVKGREAYEIASKLRRTIYKLRAELKQPDNRKRNR